MRAAFATVALAMLAAAEAVPQAVTSAIAPPGAAPSGCLPNYDGTFLISPVNVSNTKRSLDERNTQLGITLQNGILHDPQGRTGYIASNSQFQFDDPPQAGAIYTAGFSVCQNGSLAIGSDVVWFKCLSGTFFNLYLDNDAGQCIECYLIASPVNGAGGPVASGSGSTVSVSTLTSSAQSNTTITTSTAAHNGTKSTATGAGTTGKHTGVTTVTTATTAHTGAGQSSAHTTQAPQTTSSGGTAASAASSASSSGVAVAMGPIGDAFGLVAGLLAFAII